MALLPWIRFVFIFAMTLPGSFAEKLPAVFSKPQDNLAKEYQIYARARSVVDLSNEELAAKYPELKNLHFSEPQEALEPLLQKITTNVDAFFRDFPNTASLEHVRRERRRNTGDFQDRVDEKFNYIVLMRPPGSGELLEEDRSTSDGSPANNRKMEGGNLLTTGHASISLLFHSMFRSHSRFRYLGFQETQPACHVVGFAQRPEGQGMVGLFKAENISGKILVQGLAWVDPVSCQIIRMRTDLLAPREDLSLFRQTTEARYSEIRFSSISRGLFLPVEVLVTIEFQGFVFINRHRYSDYRLFTVETYEKREKPVVP